MIYLVLGCLALAFILTAGRGSARLIKRREWRFLSGGFAIAVLAVAAFVTLRGDWPVGLALAVIGAGLGVAARFNAPRTVVRSGGRMSLEEARGILGVGPNATPEEIQAAYTRLMRTVHPDKGGTSGLAAQLNAARDRLLGR
jgi:hypothetical protein